MPITKPIVLLLPDGVGVRNFVLGPFLKEACRARQVHTLHTLPVETLPQYSAGLDGNAQWHELLRCPEQPLTFVLRNCLSYAQMYWVDTFPMRYNRSRPVGGSWRTRSAVYVARVVGRAAAALHAIGPLDRLHSWAVSRMEEVEHYRELFRKINPSVLFCSHQRPIDILPPVLAARSLGIPTSSFIFSWDNITSKGRIAAPFDYYLVWSEQMRRELLHYYPQISPESIHIVGTPQFDPYADTGLYWSREEFCARIGGDPNRPLICYSGGDLGNCPVDPQHLSALLGQVRSGQVRGNPQVLLRPSPADDGTRYDAVRREYPELLYSQPAWKRFHPQMWSKLIPLPEDVALLVNTIRHADLNVNFGSTMTLDCAIHDKPVVNVAFDVDQPPRYGMPMWQYLGEFEHYRPVTELGVARVARTPAELAEHVNAYLEKPALDREGRRQFVELEVGVPIGHSSRRIIDVLEYIERSRGSHE